MRKLTLILAVIMAVCSFSAVAVTADGLFVSAGTVTLPTEADTGSMLVAWSYEKDGETVLLAPGAEFTAEQDMELSPLYLDLEMIGGASVRTATPAGLRFTTNVNEPQYQALVATGAEFELGTIIVPSEYITGEFTYDAITGAGKACLRIPCRIFWDHNDTVRTYTGVISNLYEDNYNRNFSARSYVSVTYTDGTELTFYADYNEDAHTRCAYGVSCAALADNSSNLSEDAKAVLLGYFNSVGIDVSYTPAQIGNKPELAVNNIPNGHYTVESEWMCQFHRMPETFIDDRGFQITITIEAKEGAVITEDTTIIFNGMPIEAGRYTLENGVLTIIRRHVFGEFTWAY
ncbi:MAG: hypothetical protein IJ519_01025 [Clostridia bacterium]|nr:hypothetical protein [Clostridia bacterium]